MISANLTNAIRASIYKRDGYSCALCDSPRGLQIHHCEPRSEGGSDDPMNLITLCWRCHAVAHGTRLQDSPDWMDTKELRLACEEYLADMYAPNWYPWK